MAALMEAEAVRPRNLALGKHPVLIGRQWPADPHHWTSSEFESFLAQGSWPAHTWKDHQEARRQRAIAEIKGEGYVPECVLAEDPTLQQDATESLASDAAWARFNARVATMSVDFQKAIGYPHSEAQYRTKTMELLANAFAQRSTNGPNCLHVMHEGQSLTLKLFGQSGPMGSVLVYPGKPGLLIGSIHRFEWSYISRLIVDLLREKRANIEDVWFFTGTQWGYGPSRSTVYSSET